MPPFAGFFSKDQILADALARGGWVGGTVFALGVGGRARDRDLHVPHDLHGVLGRAHRLRGASTRPATPPTARDRSRCCGRSPCWPRAASWSACSRSQAPGTWCRSSSSPGIPVLLEPTSAEELVASLLSVALGLAGILIAYALYGRITDAPARVARALDARSRASSRRSSASTPPTTGPSTGRPRPWPRPGPGCWEEPVVAGSLPVVGGVLRWTATLLSMPQSGLVRTYAIAFGLGLGGDLGVVPGPGDRVILASALNGGDWGTTHPVAPARGGARSWSGSSRGTGAGARSWRSP